MPYLAHAPMEPLNATADYRPDRLDVWIGTQNALGTLRTAAKTAGLPPEKVFVHNCFCGGGFGRRSFNDEMIQAIQVSKAVGKPVKLIWTREEDIAPRPLPPAGGDPLCGGFYRRRHAESRSTSAPRSVRYCAPAG